jgi:hypothetical protein
MAKPFETAGFKKLLRKDPPTKEDPILVQRIYGIR